MHAAGAFRSRTRCDFFEHVWTAPDIQQRVAIHKVPSGKHASKKLPVGGCSLKCFTNRIASYGNTPKLCHEFALWYKNHDKAWHVHDSRPHFLWLPSTPAANPTNTSQPNRGRECPTFKPLGVFRMSINPLRGAETILCHLFLVPFFVLFYSDNFFSAMFIVSDCFWPFLSSSLSFSALRSLSKPFFWSQFFPTHFEF